MSDTLPWDANRPYLNRADAATDFYNAGCPQGFFAQVVPPGTSDGVDIGLPNAAIRCRLVTSTTPTTLVQESSGVFAVENMTRFNEAILDEMPVIPPALALMAVVGIGLWYRGRKW